jgi:hypothetical protein
MRKNRRTLSREELYEFSEGLAEWIDWAKKYVSKIDPFTNPEYLPFILDEKSSYYW